MADQDSPPIRIAIATAKLLDRLQREDTFAMRLNVRWSFADWAAHLEKAPNSLPWVDVVPPVKPGSTLSGRYWYEHTIAVRIGVRAKLDKVTVDWSESMDPELIKPYVNLLYAIKDFFDPNPDQTPPGQVFRDEGYDWTAVVERGVSIVKAWDPELMATAKVYCGLIEVPFFMVVQR